MELILEEEKATKSYSETQTEQFGAVANIYLAKGFLKACNVNKWDLHCHLADDFM